MSRYRADKELAQVALARAAQSISVSPIFVLAEVQFNNVPLFVSLQRSKRIVLRERINYLPNESKNDLPQQVTKHDGRKTLKLEESGFPQATESQDG